MRRFLLTLAVATIVSRGFAQTAQTFDPGEVINHLPDPILCCNVQDAYELTIDATPAIGGSEVYSYQWYMVVHNHDTILLTDATEQTLRLVTLTDSLHQGETYRFIRQAKDDSSLTQWTWSRYSQSVQIFNPFTTGQIEDKIMDTYCVMDGGTDAIHITIQSLSTPDGLGTFEYRWLRINTNQPDTVVFGTRSYLDTTFSSDNIQLGSTYLYLREVRNASCGSDWVRSQGNVYQTYIANEHTDSTLVVCENELPLTVSYPDPEQGPFYHQFTHSGESYRFADLTHGYECYPTMTLTVLTKPSPVIVVDTFVLLCQDDDSITISYDVLSGCPDSFYIELSPSLAPYFDHKNHMEGIIPNPVCEGQTGTITLHNVQRVGMGVHYIYLQVGTRTTDSQNICFSTKQYMELEVNLGGYIYPKYNKVLIVDNAPDNPDRLTFTAYQWYKDGVRLYGQNRQYYDERGQILSGTYYVELTIKENGTLVNYKSCEIHMPNEPLQEHYEANTAPRLCVDQDRVFLQMTNGQQIDILGRTVK